MKNIEIIFSILIAALAITLTTANIAFAETSQTGSSSGGSDSAGSTNSGTGSSSRKKLNMGSVMPTVNHTPTKKKVCCFKIFRY